MYTVYFFKYKPFYADDRKIPGFLFGYLVTTCVGSWGNERVGGLSRFEWSGCARKKNLSLRRSGGICARLGLWNSKAFPSFSPIKIPAVSSRSPFQ